MSMNTIPEALDELRAGHIIIVVDDPRPRKRRAT